MRKLAARRGPGAKRRGGKPNILFIISDDQPKRRTWTRTVMPNAFDRFVDNGLEYHNGFVSSAWCGPTRWTFHSGRYEHTHGIIETGNFTYRDGKNAGLLNDSISTRMSAGGYRVGHIGKFQNGYFNFPNDLPAGFDLSAWFVWASDDTQDPPFAFNEYGTVVNWAGTIHNTSDRITLETVNFINGHAGRPDPFFVSVGYLDPHYPYEPDPAHPLYGVRNQR